MREKVEKLQGKLSDLAIFSSTPKWQEEKDKQMDTKTEPRQNLFSLD